MTTLPTQSFQAMVSNIVAGIQGRSAKLLNFSAGSTLRAIVEGFAGLFLWLQALVLQLLTATRLSTSSGNDVDTFTADFMPLVAGTTSPRLGAQASTGQVTFGRFTAAPSSAFIAVGATVQSSDGTQNFTVTADTTNTSYSAALSGYTLSPSVATVNVPVQNTVRGSAGNVAVGAISVMTSPITGIDYVTNAAGFTNGTDQESDVQLKARFVLFIQSLQKATEGAIGFAIASLHVGMQWQILENMDPNGATDYGAFTVYVDDGSGAIPTATLTAAQNAVFAISAAGTRPQVLAATTLLANPTMTLVTATGYDHPTVVAAVVAAIGSYINGIGLGTTPAAGALSYMKLAAVAFGVAGVTDVLNYTLNGGNSDLVPARGQVIKVGSIIAS
jgi:hypothetical protein